MRRINATIFFYFRFRFHIQDGAKILEQKKEQDQQQKEEYSYIRTSECNEINTKHKYNETHWDKQI